MTVYKAQRVVTNYLDVSTNAPKNPVNGQKWMDGTVMKTWDETKKEWVADDLKGADGKDTYIHKAWSWSSDGTDRFTDKYPNENLFRGKLAVGGLVWVTGSEYDDSDRVRSEFLSVDGLHRYIISLNSVFSDNSKVNVFQYDSNKKCLTDNTYNTKSRNTIDTLKDTRFIRILKLKSIDINLKYKIEEGTTNTIYTPSPNDDYDNAYPTYEGYYSSHNPVQSTNPSDYTWTVDRGENGKDGADGKDGIDGKDGVTPKDVISGYLSNESIIVPATPTGAVTDLSKAFGDFVVFEGQTKKTSGVTYTKVSEVGMTSSINSNGRYVVSALSADTGTATYRATYSGVTIDKIMIVVKNKQGPSGTNGADGKDGSQGPQGVPGKDGANGKDGAIGPQGPPTGITTSDIVPTSPYVGMLWQNTGDVAGYLKGVTYRWTGAKWDIYIFRAENIAANSLSAISANLGTITAGEIITSFFRGDSISSAIKKRGTTSISNGQFRSSFDYVQVTTNTVLGKGDVVLDENGFMIRDLTTSDEVLRSVSYKPDKIIMTDANFSYGEVNLKYQDLLNLPQISLEGINGWEKYATSGGSAPMVERNMRTVTLTGAFKPVTTISHTGLEQFTVCVLPIGYRPKKSYSTIAPGSGIRLALINVEPNGAVTISRNRNNNGYTDYLAGGWYSIACSFSAADI